MLLLSCFLQVSRSRDSGRDTVRRNWTWVQFDGAIRHQIDYSHPKRRREHAFIHSRRRAFEKRLAGLPVVKHPAREVVLTAGSKTGRLFFLRSGAVEVIKDGERIANVSAPGSVFGEQAVLLDQPHTADVRTLEQSEFYVADAQAMLTGDPTVALYVAAILARRLDAANRSLIEVKHQVQNGESPQCDQQNGREGGRTVKLLRGCQPYIRRLSLRSVSA